MMGKEDLPMSAVRCAGRPGTEAVDRLINVVIVEDYAPFHALYKQVLAEHPAIRCAGVAATGQEALRLAEELRPDVLLLDISLPDGHWMGTMRLLKAVCPTTQIVVLGEEGREDYRVAAKASGASAYLRKQHTIEYLVPLILDLTGQPN